MIYCLILGSGPAGYTAAIYAERFPHLPYKNYSEPHSQNRLFKAHLLLMWLPRHINL